MKIAAAIRGLAAVSGIPIAVPSEMPPTWLTGVSPPISASQRPLPRWELGDLLGVHPHLMPDHGIGSLGQLLAPPGRRGCLLARRAPRRSGRRMGHRPAATLACTIGPEPADTDVAADVDALTVLTALATTTVPATIEQLDVAVRTSRNGSAGETTL